MGSLVSVLNWTCDKCKYINEIESLQCSYCQTPRKSDQIETDSVDGETEHLFASYSSSDEENDKFETVKRIQCGKKEEDKTKESSPGLFDIGPITSG